MEHTIDAVEARRQFGKLLNAVAGKRDRYVVQRDGEAVAAVVPIELYEQWQRSREAFFERMEGAARRANLSESEGMALAREAVEAVRKQRRASQAPSRA
jgi:prevent-host-death family protein